MCVCSIVVDAAPAAAIPLLFFLSLSLSKANSSFAVLVLVYYNARTTVANTSIALYIEWYT